jgi:mannose-6-phosphate isomerase-like protein (cupin superfamily)
MSSFSTVNLREVDDSVGDRAPGIQGRFARKHLDSRDLGVSLFSYAANFRSPMAHSHREQEEAYVVVSGSGRVLLDGEIVELREWDVVRVAPEVVRAFEAGADGLELVAIGGPKPPDGDGVRAEADWPEQG